MGMEERYEFDDVTLFSAFAMGVPGKRTFFLAIGQKEKWVRVWVEKYLLETLALAIDQFLFTLSQEHLPFGRRVEKIPLSDNAPSGLPSAELEIDQITLDFDRERAVLNLMVHPSGPRRAEQAELHCRVTPSQLRKLGKQAKSICAAGRPICELCGNPIDPAGHICPGSN